MLSKAGRNFWLLALDIYVYKNKVIGEPQSACKVKAISERYKCEIELEGVIITQKSERREPNSSDGRSKPRQYNCFGDQFQYCPAGVYILVSYNLTIRLTVTVLCH